MDKRSIIKDMYWHIEEISDSLLPESSEYEEAKLRREEAEKRLLAILPEGGQKVFEKFMEAYGDVEILEDEELYRQGFNMGLQITAEAYMSNKNRLGIYGED